MMIYEKFRHEMKNFRQREIERAKQAKEMNLVWINLEKLYSRFDVDETKLANRVIDEWLQSEDSSLRGDAEYLIDSCNIRTAKDGLVKLASRLLEVVNPSIVVKHELEKVQRILTKIAP